MIEKILVGLIVTLILGSYGYSFLQGRDLRAEIRQLWAVLTNHFEHRLEATERRLDQLEHNHK